MINQKNQEMFLDQNDNLIVNERIFNILKKHRIIRAKYTEFHIDEAKDFEKEIDEQPVLKKGHKKTAIETC